MNKYRYIVTKDVSPSNLIKDCDLISSNNLASHHMAVRLTIPENMNIKYDKATGTYNMPNADIPINMFDYTPMVRVNGQWTIMQLLKPVPIANWKEYLMTSSEKLIYTPNRGFIKANEYNKLCEDYKQATAGILALKNKQKAS